MHSSVVVAATKEVKNETSTSDENSSESDNDLDLDTLHSYPMKKLVDYCKAEEVVVKGRKKIDYIRAIKEYNQVSDSSDSDSTSDDDSLFLNFNNIKNKSSSKSGPKLDNFNYYKSFTSHQSTRYPYSSHAPAGISEDEMIRLALEESLRSSQEIKPTQTQSAPSTPAPKKKEKLKKPEFKKDTTNNRKKRSPKGKKSFNFSTLPNPTEPSTAPKPKKKNGKKKKQNFKQLSASFPSNLRIEDDDSDEEEMLKRAIAESLKQDTTSSTSPASETKSTTTNTCTTSSESSSVPSPRHIDADAALALSLHLEQQKELKKERKIQRKRQRQARLAYNAELARNPRSSNSSSNNNLNHFGSSNGYASREASLAALQDFFSRMGGNVHGGPMYIPPIASNMNNNTFGGRNRYRGRYIDPDNMTYEELLELEEQIGEVKKKGIDENVIAANTQIFVFSKKVESLFDDCDHDLEHVENVDSKEITNTKYITCSVCLMDFDDGDTLRALPCVHCYHKDCIDRWLQEKGKCPVCQMDVGSA